MVEVLFALPACPGAPTHRQSFICLLSRSGTSSDGKACPKDSVVQRFEVEDTKSLSAASGCTALISSYYFQIWSSTAPGDAAFAALGLSFLCMSSGLSLNLLQVCSYTLYRSSRSLLCSEDLLCSGMVHSHLHALLLQPEPFSLLCADSGPILSLLQESSDAWQSSRCLCSLSGRLCRLLNQPAQRKQTHSCLAYCEGLTLQA